MTDTSRDDPVWRTPAPDLRARKTDAHLALAVHPAKALLDAPPEAARDIGARAILPHDTGWSSIDLEPITPEGFGAADVPPSEVPAPHAAQGPRPAREVPGDTGRAPRIIAAVADIIDGHEPGPEPRHRADRIERDLAKAATETGPEMAVRELARSRAASMLPLL